MLEALEDQCLDVQGEALSYLPFRELKFIQRTSKNVRDICVLALRKLTTFNLAGQSCFIRVW